MEGAAHRSTTGLRITASPAGIRLSPRGRSRGPLRRCWEEIFVPEAPPQSNLRWELHLEEEERKKGEERRGEKRKTATAQPLQERTSHPTSSPTCSWLVEISCCTTGGRQGAVVRRPRLDQVRTRCEPGRATVCRVTTCVAMTTMEAGSLWFPHQKPLMEHVTLVRLEHLRTDPGQQRDVCGEW